MAGIARKDVEILVHTTAPSRGLDDARYRRIAEAYLDFQPARSRRLEENLSNSAIGEPDNEARGQLQDELQEAVLATQKVPQSGASYHPDESSTEEEDVYEYIVEHRLSLSQELHSPSMSFNSAVDNANSPIFRARVTQYVDLPEPHLSQRYEIPDSWVAPPNEVPDSQPEVNTTMTAFSSPTRMLELYLQNQESQATRSTPDKSPGQPDKTSSLELPSGLRGALSSSPDHGLTPSSPSPVKGPERRPERILEPRSLNPPSTQDPALNLKRDWVSSGSEESYPSSAPPGPLATIIQVPMSSQPPPSRPEKRARLEPPSFRGFVSSQPTPTFSKPVATPNASSFQIPGIWWELLEIHPNPPVTSSGDLTPEIFITPHLAAIAKRMPPSLYCPISKTRDLRDMERGYWLLECKGWNENLQQRCWDALGRYIGKDLAGWGVWCKREEDFKSIRVYCWGVVVGHIYLLLYMASDSKIKKAGARWIGGDGETIIQMP
ncbi:hypothetical protein DL95DRAFT_391562 [Leptodontidium sp. 2 PMI_412]|nr:hypothetical protein DL95DRAFT_391562 [Leptodontidium sp. 2 PMI_412]